jgi:glycosidase
LNPVDRVTEYLEFLYGAERAPQIAENLQQMIHNYQPIRSPQSLDAHDRALTETDALLITYGDQLQAPGEAPLHTLHKFLKQHLGSVLNGLHILPFYPYSTDDGFSVIDYRQVDPRLGAWGHIHALSQDYRLMFDAVVNHISRRSDWFEGFLRGQPSYQDYFIVADPMADYSMVARPRTLPLLTPVDSVRGREYVWTTFSEDQIDLNYANPQVLLEMVNVLLFYASQGASLIRLDAIAYLWKEMGTSCIHLPQTHAVVKLLRAVLDLVAPQVHLITETNVPHAQNIAYFGQILPGSPRTDEAQLVYQFPLAPLLLHTFRTGDCSILQDWVTTLSTPAASATFFNFTASHDGIGLQPAYGLLAESDLQALVEKTLMHGGQVSYKTNPDGSRSVYELNITWYDALNDPRQPVSDLDLRRFMASQVIMLSLAGVPGIYFHSLIGSRSCQPCFTDTQQPRSLNRQKLVLDRLEAQLSDPANRHHLVLGSYRRLLEIRRRQPAFHPAAAQEALELNGSVFGLLRRSAERGQPVLCLVNVTPHLQIVEVDPSVWDMPIRVGLYDLIQQRTSLPGKLVLEPYQAMWLISR